MKTIALALVLGGRRAHAREQAAAASARADMEALRTHLGIERWLVFGGSWGSTRPPSRSITISSRCPRASPSVLRTLSPVRVDALIAVGFMFGPLSW